MQELQEVAPPFVEMAHGIVWCNVATVDREDRPRSRILHPVWQWDGDALVGWIGTGPTPVKRAHLNHSPFVSCSYWSPNHDNCVAECRASLFIDDDTCVRAWELLKSAPEPVGFDPAIVPAWSDGPTSDAFAAMRLDPWRLRVFPGTVLMGEGGEVLEWQAEGK
ncbi:MAG: pyridoxamine 5'-phosphate oxidase family protein [Thermomicrobiales bacterium]